MDQQEFWEDFQHLKRESITLRDSVARLNVLRGRYRALMDSGIQFVAYLDKEGRFLDISQSALRALEMAEGDVIDHLHVEVFKDEPSRKVGSVAAEVIRKKELQDFEWTVTRASGSKLTFQTVAVPVRDENGTVIAACITALPVASPE